ncbi:MAG: hypothetical protein RIS09_138 [Actinomycetota bacterium]|jgi:transcriptional regulator with GAF, ATPase, and Fis domain
MSKRQEYLVSKIRDLKSTSNPAEKICVVAAEILQCDIASICLTIANTFNPVATTSKLGTYLDEEQFVLGDGPTFLSRFSSSPIHVENFQDKSSIDAYPAFSRVAMQHELVSAHVFPLSIGSAQIGALTLYFKHPVTLSSDQYADCLILATLATAELVRLQAGIDGSSVNEMFESQQLRKSVLQIAAGMTAEKLNCNVIEALVRIRALAFSLDLPVTELAQKIVNREISIEE